MKIVMIICSIFTLVFFSACASKPDNLTTSYVSPMRFNQYDCNQLYQEMDYVSQRTLELYHSLNRKANADTAQMTVGLILFWPTLFFLEGGDGPEASEYSRLKGEYEALRKSSIQKKCENAQSIVPFNELIKQNEQQKQEAEKNNNPNLNNG